MISASKRSSITQASAISQRCAIRRVLCLTRPQFWCASRTISSSSQRRLNRRALLGRGRLWRGALRGAGEMCGRGSAARLISADDEWNPRRFIDKWCVDGLCCPNDAYTGVRPCLSPTGASARWSHQLTRQSSRLPRRREHVHWRHAARRGAQIADTRQSSTSSSVRASPRASSSSRCAASLPIWADRTQDEAHWIVKPQNSLLWYTQVLDWLDRPCRSFSPSLTRPGWAKPDPSPSL